MGAQTIALEVVTPERVVMQAQVDSIVAPATLGYLGVLANHAPLVTGLEIGVIRFRQQGQQNLMAICGGFMEVKDNKAVILADTAETADQIDVDRASRARERAQQRLTQKPHGLDYARAEMALKRALIRLRVAGQ